MKSVLLPVVSSFFLIFLALSNVQAQVVVEEFEIEGLVTPTDPEALQAGLEKEPGVKVLGLNLKDTPSGWPVIRVEFDSSKMSRAQIEDIIDATPDSTGKPFKAHKGPSFPAVVMLEEEKKAMAILGDGEEEIPKVVNPVEPSEASISRGKARYEKSCATCHGLRGNGFGPASQSVTTPPRPLTVEHDEEGEDRVSHLFWRITNGRTDMPPYSLLLSEEERWDVINYILTLKAPEKE
jgi:mono/diheme cytochrome c family protein